MSNISNHSIFRNLLSTALCEEQESYLISSLFEQFPTLELLLSVSERELMQIDGITREKARQIVSTLKLASMNALPQEERPQIKGPDDIYRLMSKLQYEDREHCIVLGLSTKNQVILEKVISIGSLNSSIVHPRECFKPLIRCSCAGTILVHNHPSGDPTPSDEDIAITERLVQAGNLLGIVLFDHIIIGRNCYTSLRETGRI